MSFWVVCFCFPCFYFSLPSKQLMRMRQIWIFLRGFVSWVVRTNAYTLTSCDFCVHPKLCLWAFVMGIRWDRECFLRMCSAFPVRHASTTHSSMQLLCTLWSLDGPGGLEELTISISGFWGPFCRPLLLELSFLAAVIDEVEKMLCIIADSVHFWLGLIEVTNVVLIKNQLGRAKGSEERLNDGKM